MASFGHEVQVLEKSKFALREDESLRVRVRGSLMREEKIFEEREREVEGSFYFLVSRGKWEIG